MRPERWMNYPQAITFLARTLNARDVPAAMEILGVAGGLSSHPDEEIRAIGRRAGRMQALLSTRPAFAALSSSEMNELSSIGHDILGAVKRNRGAI